MADVKLSALTDKTTSVGTEEVLVNDSGTSKKISLNNLGISTLAQTALNGKVSINTSASDPTVNDDTLAGYSEGWGWINSTSGEAFVCIDPTNGVAIWKTQTNDHSTTQLDGGFF